VSELDHVLISVIVPTHDRAQALGRCLDNLAAQTAAETLEVIVVDDGSQPSDDVASVVARHPRAQLIRQAASGPAAARNRGARAARGAYLCFTDDDCAPGSDWAERLADVLQRGADAVAGTTVSSGGALGEASELVAHAPAAAPAPNGSDLSFAPSNNLACTKAVFDAVPFDESYPNAAGEDRDWCARLIEAGFVLRSEPAARIVHHQELTSLRFLRQQIRYGQAAYRFRRGGEHRPLETLGFYRALVRRAFAQGIGVGLLVAAAQAATAAGFIHGWINRRRSLRAVKTSTASAPPVSREHDR
jgi:glycosyltransferase involved in cell wall biosynthesis